MIFLAGMVIFKPTFLLFPALVLLRHTTQRVNSAKHEGSTRIWRYGSAFSVEYWSDITVEIG